MLKKDMKLKTTTLSLLLFCLLAQAQVFIEQGRFGGAGSLPGQFNKPAALSVSAEKILFVADTDNHRLQLFTLQGRFLRTIGGFGFGDEQFDRPMDIWTRAVINLYIADYNNQRVVRYNRNLNFISTLTSNESLPREFRFEEVLSCALNSQQDLFLLDRGENKVIKFDRNGVPQRAFGYYESGEGELEEPQQLEIQNNSYVLVSDLSRGSLMVFDFFGNFIRELKTPEMKGPAGLAVDRDNRVFITDRVANKIFIVSNDLRQVYDLPLRLTQPPTALRDVAVWNEPGSKQQALLYLIDDNQIVFGKLVNE